MSEAVNDFKTFARNAKGVRELLSMKFDTLPFEGDGMMPSVPPRAAACG